jgi:hypothetical protein
MIHTQSVRYDTDKNLANTFPMSVHTISQGATRVSCFYSLTETQSCGPFHPVMLHRERLRKVDESYTGIGVGQHRVDLLVDTNV